MASGQSNFTGLTAVYHGKTAREQAILNAFHRWVHKDHEFSTACSGCIDAAAWLTVPAYNGGYHTHPLIH